MFFESLFHSGESMHKIQMCCFREPFDFLVTNINSVLGGVKPRKHQTTCTDRSVSFRCGCRKGEE